MTFQMFHVPRFRCTRNVHVYGDCQYSPLSFWLQMAHFVKAPTKRKPPEMLEDKTNHLNKLQILTVIPHIRFIGNEYLLKFFTYFAFSLISGIQSNDCGRNYQENAPAWGIPSTYDQSGSEIRSEIVYAIKNQLILLAPRWFFMA